MTVIARISPALAASGSVLMLSAALFFQFILDYQPCELCVWQRWPHALAGIAFIGWLWNPKSWWFVVGCLMMLIGGGLASYHWGIENQWWDGLTQCSRGMAGKNLQLGIDWSAPVSVMRCDEVTWSFLNLSMAGWNMVLSVVLAILWIVPFGSHMKVKS